MSHALSLFPLLFFFSLFFSPCLISPSGLVWLWQLTYQPVPQCLLIWTLLLSYCPGDNKGACSHLDTIVPPISAAVINM